MDVDSQVVPTGIFWSPPGGCRHVPKGDAVLPWSLVISKEVSVTPTQPPLSLAETTVLSSAWTTEAGHAERARAEAQVTVDLFHEPSERCTQSHDGTHLLWAEIQLGDYEAVGLLSRVKPELFPTLDAVDG